MTLQKALAVASLLLAGAVVRIEIGKVVGNDADAFWLGHLDAIAEVLRPSALCRRGVRRLDPLERLSWFPSEDQL